MPPYSPTPGRTNAAGRPTMAGKGLLNTATPSGSAGGLNGRGAHSRGVGVSSGGKGKGKSKSTTFRRQRYVCFRPTLDIVKLR